MKLNLRIHIITILFLGFLSCKTQKNISIYESDNLKVVKLTKSTFTHISYLSTEDFGKVGCNGMIVIDNNEALIFDTPTNDSGSKELIDWIENTLESTVIGVVVTHFHTDCLGGLNEFHARQITSYASLKTIESVKLDSTKTTPQIGFNNYSEIKVGEKEVLNEFFGEGHTSDNIVSYVPDEKILFGGCLIKTLGANRGYLGDANINEWSKTVQAVKSKYEYVRVIIPGHGKSGNTDLLDYTIDLFNNE